MAAPSGSRRVAIATAAMLLLALWLYLVLQRQQSEWTDGYVRAARTLLAGGDIYGPGTNYPYPPFAATLAIVCVPLSEGAARSVWLALNVLALPALLWSVWHAAGADRDAGCAHHRWWALLLSLACAGPYLQNALAHHQVDVLIAALAVSGAAALVRGRYAAGAVWIGLAAAFKGPPACSPATWPGGASGAASRFSA